ncbi:YqfQ family protein [Pontibacillus sp. HMF3514]|uniref:YqfQ family protein n=1 Tax=Pontibacillus sp. HMF3514 TaxID=2692425 RepID=UPI001F23A025|nr:YqfQ family protein [Pontibacillus sp. HMF3514]
MPPGIRPMGQNGFMPGPGMNSMNPFGMSTNMRQPMPFSGFEGPQSFFNQGSSGWNGMSAMNGMQGFPNMQGMGSRAGGNLLSNLFQSSAGGGGLPQLGALGQGVGSAGGGVSGMLNNVQQVLKMAQSAAPMIQQYGPMVRNIPTMVKLMKIMREPDEGEIDENNSSEQQGIQSQPSSQNSDEINKNSQQVQSNQPTTTNGASQPRLYI